MTNKCALCGSPLTHENNSKEHLIPNAIGGRRKVRGFLCENCNNKTGHDWDCGLTKQLNFLSLHFGISRERDAVPPMVLETTGGEKIRLKSDGSLEIEKPRCEVISINEKMDEIHIEARSLSEAGKMINGLTKKYSNLKADEALASAKNVTRYSDDMISARLQIGGEKAGRSIVKSTVALAADSKIATESCEEAMNYLTQQDAAPCFVHYYKNNLIKNRPSDTVFHCVSIAGFPDTRQLIGYVEYFSVHRILVSLSKQYNGDAFSITYAIDPVSGRELDLDVEILPENFDEIAKLQYTDSTFNAIKQAFDIAIPIGLKTQWDRARETAIKESVDYAFRKLGRAEGEELTAEDCNKLSKFFMEKFTPFLEHWYQCQKKNQ